MIERFESCAGCHTPELLRQTSDHVGSSLTALAAKCEQVTQVVTNIPEDLQTQHVIGEDIDRAVTIVSISTILTAAANGIAKEVNALKCDPGSECPRLLFVIKHLDAATATTMADAAKNRGDILPGGLEAPTD